jgi:integrase
VASIRRCRTQSGIRYEVRWRDALGRDRSQRFNLERDARRFKVDVERRAQLGLLYEAGPVTFAEFVDGWLDRFEPRVRRSSYERAVQALRALDGLDSFRVHEIRASDVEDRIAQIARRAPRQAAIALQLLKRVLRSAQDRGHRIDAGVFAIDPPRHEEREPRFLTWMEVEHLASHCAEPRLVVFAALTGLRQGEVFALRRADLDVPGRVVRVERSSRAGAVTRTKTGGKRAVYLSLIASEAASEQLAFRSAGALDLVFPSPAGAMWRKDNFMARVFRPAVRRAGLDGLTFHDLRHTAASLMIAAGVPPMIVAEQLGHRDARLVLQRYGHLYPGASAHAARALDAFLLDAAVGHAWGDALGGGEAREDTPANPEWSVPGSNRRPPACKAGALPAELTPRAFSV